MRRIFGRATLGFLELSERMKQWIEIGYDPVTGVNPPFNDPIPEPFRNLSPERSHVSKRVVSVFPIVLLEPFQLSRSRTPLLPIEKTADRQQSIKRVLYAVAERFLCATAFGEDWRASWNAWR